MNYGEIKKNDIANGEGVRVSIFVSGCRHHCKNCFNACTWDFGYGDAWTEEVENMVLAACAPSYVSGLSLLGGEPMEPENQRVLLPFLKRFRQTYPNKSVWCYSGYTIEELTDGRITYDKACELPERAVNAHRENITKSPRCECTDEMLEQIDVLVDGEFVEELKDITLQFRGSKNQRILKLR